MAASWTDKQREYFINGLLEQGYPADTAMAAIEEFEAAGAAGLDPAHHEAVAIANLAWHAEHGSPATFADDSELWDGLMQSPWL